MEEIVNLIGAYGIDTIILALSVNVLTGVLKIPVKRLSLKLEPKGINLNKYITLLPIALGFAVASLATGLVFERGIFWNERTPVLAITVSSLSLSIYAVCEKFFGSTKKIPDIADKKVDATQEKTNGLTQKLDDRITENMQNNNVEIVEITDRELSEVGDKSNKIVPDENKPDIKKFILKKRTDKDSKEREV